MTKGNSESESVYQLSSCGEQVFNEREKNSPLSEEETAFVLLLFDREKKNNQ